MGRTFLLVVLCCGQLSCSTTPWGWGGDKDGVYSPAASETDGANKGAPFACQRDPRICEAVGCLSDRDCKEDRRCIDAQCQQPPASKKERMLKNAEHFESTLVP